MKNKPKDEELVFARQMVSLFQTATGVASPGDVFYPALIRAIMLADNENLARFRKSFPAFVVAVEESRSKSRQ